MKSSGIFPEKFMFVLPFFLISQ